MLYECSLYWDITLAGSQSLSVWTCTESPILSTVSVHAILSQFSFVLICDSSIFILAMFRLIAFGASCSFVDESIDLRRWLNINWVIVRSPHDFKGELRSCKNGRYGSRLSSFAFL